MNWVERAEAVLNRPPGSDAEPADSDVERVPVRRPTLLDAFGHRALLAPVFAACVWAIAIFREQLTHPLEPIALLLRLVALALTVRVIVLGVVFARRVRVIAERDRYKLALTSEGLLLRTPQADYALPKHDIIAVCEPGDWQERGGSRWGDVYVVTRPSTGRTHVVLPPLFERTPGVLAERLMRWRGVDPPDERGEPQERVPAELPSKLFDAAAAGQAPAGVAVIRHGRGWLQRAPFATVLLGIVLLEGFLRMPAAGRERVGVAAPLVITLCLLIAPLFWWLATNHDIAPRKGIALLLTPAELMFRTRGGVHRVAWAQLLKLQITSRKVWTVLQGSHPSRTLVIQRKDEDAIHYTEVFLGAPAEVVVALCEGYRKGVLP